MAQYVVEAGNGTNIIASAQIASGIGRLMGIWVSSASATPTIKVWDSLTAAGGIIANTFTPAAGTYYPIPVRFGTGLYVTISGTIDCTVVYVKDNQ